MRNPSENQVRFSCPSILEITFETISRHRINRVLQSLQRLYSQPNVLGELLTLIAEDTRNSAEPDDDREGIRCWRILVLAALKDGCRFTDDMLWDFSDNHRRVRAMLDLGDGYENTLDWNRVRGDLGALRPETIKRINRTLRAG